MSAEWGKLFERETALIKKGELSNEEADELIAVNSRFLEMLANMEQLETEIYQIYMSQHQESKE